MAERILVVDDERLTRETLAERLADEGYEVVACASAYEALDELEQAPADVVLTDLRMPSMDGVEFHRRVRERWPETDVVFITAFGTVQSAVEAMREGAADYLTKPLNTDELLIRLRRILDRQRDRAEIRRLRAAAPRHRFGDLVYRSAAMRAVVERAATVADSDITVLVKGPTGTGKEVLCRAIHAASGRADGPFVVVNCAGLNPNLVESELFGHEAGAFTGATRMRKGRLEVADGGTLLIDEVDDLSLEVQVRLLRFLQDRTFERVGSSRTLRSDVRVLCATKRSLPELVAEGRFREDLLYRINTVVIELPPLAERPEDILPLAEHFARRTLGRTRSEEGGEGGPGSIFTPEAARALLSYAWPGNVRELQHAVEHALAFAGGGPIEPRHLPDAVRGTSRLVPPVELHLSPEAPVPLPELLRACERQVLDWALSQTGGNQARAADLLGVPRTTLRSRLEALREGDPTS